MALLPVWIPESPEALQLKHEADDKFEANWKKYEDNPDLAFQEKNKAKEALWYGEFSEGREKQEVTLEELTETLNELGLQAVSEAVAKIRKKEEHIPLQEIVRDVLLSEDAPSYLSPSDKETIMVFCFPSRFTQQGEFDTPTDSIEQWEIEEKVEEVPGIPKLQRLVENNTISPEEFEGISEKIGEGEVLWKAIEATIKDSWTKETLLSIFSPETPQEKSENFFKDMPEYVANDREDPTIQLISENYTKIPWVDGEKASNEENFKTAIQEAANTVVDGKIFERTEGFERAMETIQLGEDKEAMYVALGEVHRYVNNYTGMRGKAWKEKLRVAQKKKNEALTQQEITFQELIAKAKKNTNSEQQARIQKVMEASQAEENDTVDTGDLGLWWELDIFWEDISDTPKKAA